MTTSPLLIVAAALAALGAGCLRFTEDAPATLRADAGTHAGADASADAAPDEGILETRCDRAGGYAKVEAAMRGLPAALSMDCRVAARFVALAPDRRAHLAECMALQLGSILACSRNGARMKYPADDAAGVLCRDMRGAHRGMGVAAIEADAFVQSVVTLLRAAGIPEAELTAVRDALDFQRRDIVETDAGPADACPTDAPAGDTPGG